MRRSSDIKLPFISFALNALKKKHIDSLNQMRKPIADHPANAYKGKRGALDVNTSPGDMSKLTVTIGLVCD